MTKINGKIPSILGRINVLKITILPKVSYRVM